MTAAVVDAVAAMVELFLMKAVRAIVELPKNLPLNFKDRYTVSVS